MVYMTLFGAILLYTQAILMSVYLYNKEKWTAKEAINFYASWILSTLLWIFTLIFITFPPR